MSFMRFCWSWYILVARRACSFCSFSCLLMIWRKSLKSTIASRYWFSYFRVSISIEESDSTVCVWPLSYASFRSNYLISSSAARCGIFSSWSGGTFDSVLPINYRSVSTGSYRSVIDWIYRLFVLVPVNSYVSCYNCCKSVIFLFQTFCLSSFLIFCFSFSFSRLTISFSTMFIYDFLRQI